MNGSYWFNRFCKDVKNISPYIEVVPIKHDFCRVYWKGGGNYAYLYEVPTDMTELGYEWIHENPRLESQEFFEEYEDNIDYIKQVKNFKEGYWEALDRIQTQYYMFMNNQEYRDTAIRGYSTMHVK